MKAQVYVDRLFQDYEDTQELREFKEEIVANLQERIRELQTKGLTEEEAFDKAVAELGDITQIAEEISRQKRKEVIGQMYIRSKVPMSEFHAIGYVVAAGVILFGLLSALTVYASTGHLTTSIASLLPFTAVPVAALVFLYLTQETARVFPMEWKRAALYAAAVGAVVFGLGAAVFLYFEEAKMLGAVYGTLIAFVVPGLCLGAFLFLTEKDRRKPWVREEERFWMEYTAKKYGGPEKAEQVGLLSGALWIATVAVFLVLGFTIGFKYAWIVFLLALSVELLIQYWAGAKF